MSGEQKNNTEKEDSLPSSIASDEPDFFDIEKEHAHLFIDDDPDSQESDFSEPEHGAVDQGYTQAATPKLVRLKSVDPDISDDFSLVKSKSFDFESSKEMKSEETQRLHDENRVLRTRLEEIRQNESIKLSEIKYLQESLMHKQISINELNEQNQSLLQQIASLADGNTTEVYDQSKLIQDLKIDLDKKEKELERLRSVENSFKQTKAVLKDTSWTLRVKELELNNIRTEMRESYEKRLSELQIRLTDRDKKLQELQAEKLDFIETENDNILRIDELSQQIHLLKDEIDLKDGNSNQLQYQLSVSEMERETLAKASTLNTDILNKELDALKMELEKYKSTVNEYENSKAEPTKDQLSKSHGDSNVQDEIENLKSIIQEKDCIIDHINEESKREITHLQNEISKGKCHINELILLLEGVSTNSDRLPTGMVENTAVAPMPSHLTSRRRRQSGTESLPESAGEKSEIDSAKDFFHDSFDTIEDLEHDADFSDGAASLKQQMTHTIDRYETQIKELQNLYDHDIFTLEAEKKELLEKYNDISDKYNTLKNTEKMTNLTNTELIAHYEEKLKTSEAHFEKLVNDEKLNATSTNRYLQEENERLRTLIVELEEKISKEVQETEKPIERKFSDNYEEGLPDILEAQHEHMVEIQRELESELSEIQEKHEQEVTMLHSQSDDISEKDQMEELFSQQLLKLHEQQNELTSDNRNLQAELNSVQLEYDNLKERFDKLSKANNRLEEQLENEKLNHKQQIELLNEKLEALPSDSSERLTNVTPLKEVLEQKVQTEDFFDKSDKVEQIIQTEASYDNIEEKQEALQSEIKLLRENLEQAKGEVKTLHEEKDKFSDLNDILTEELQNLKAEFEGQQNSFAVLGHSSFPTELENMEVNELEEANENLKKELKILREELDQAKLSIPSDNISPPIEETKLEASRVDNFEDLLKEDNISSNNQSGMINKDHEIEELRNQVSSLTAELTALKVSLEESKEMNDENVKNLQDQLHTKEEVGQHLQEVFSQQLDYSQTQNKELLKTIDTLKEANTKLKKEIQESLKERNSLKDNIQNVSDRLSDLKDIESKYYYEKKIKEEYQELVQSMKGQLKEKDDNLLQFLSKNDELKKKLDQCQKNINELNKQSEIKADEFEESMKIKNSEIELLRNQISELTEEWSGKEKDLNDEHDRNTEILKESLMKYNVDSLQKLREDLDDDYIKRLKTVEDKLHEEYAFKLKQLHDLHENKINDLQSSHEVNLNNQKQAIEAEHKKVIGTVKSAMERTQVKEIAALQESYEKDIETVKYALQLEHEAEVRHVTNELESTHSRLLSELELSLNSTHEMQISELKSTMERENERNVEEIVLKMQQDFEKELDLERARYEMLLKDLEEKLKHDYGDKYKGELDDLKEKHKEESKAIKDKYENDILIMQQKHSLEIDNLNEKNRENLYENLGNVNKDFDKKLNVELEKQKEVLQRKHSEEILKIVNELKEESKTYLNATVTEIQTQNNNEIEKLKAQQRDEIKKKEDEKKEIELTYEKKMASKENELNQQITSLLDDIKDLHKHSAEQEVKFHEQLSEELLSKNEDLSTEHSKELSRKDDEIENLKKIHDLEIKSLEDKYVAQIATINLEHRANILKAEQESANNIKDKESKIMECYEKVEQRRAAEEELQQKLVAIETKYAEALDMQEDLSSKIKLEEAKFQEKRLNDIALIHWDLLSHFSLREMTREDDLKSKLNELQMFHNECIEKFDIEKSELQKEILALSEKANVFENENANLVKKNKSLQNELKEIESRHADSILQNVSNLSDKDENSQIISLGSDDSVPSSAAEDFVLLALKNSVENLTGESPSLDLSESFVKSPKRESSKKLKSQKKLSPQKLDVYQERAIITTDQYVQTDEILFLTDRSIQTESDLQERKHEDEIEKLTLQLAEFNDEKIKLDEELANLNSVNEQLKLVNEQLERELDKQIEELKNKDLIEKQREESQTKEMEEKFSHAENENKILIDKNNELVEKLEISNSERDALGKELSSLKENFESELRAQREKLATETKQKVKSAEDAKTLEYENSKNALLLQHQQLLDEFVMEQEDLLTQLKHEHAEELEKLKNHYNAKQIEELNDLRKQFEEKLNQELEQKIDVDNPSIQELLLNEKEKLEFNLREEYKKMVETLNEEHSVELNESLQQKEKELLAEHESKLQVLAEQIESQQMEQLKAIDEIQAKNKQDLENFQTSHVKEIENLKEKHNKEMDEFKENFEKRKSEEINAVSESVEEEIQIMKDQMKKGYDMKIEELENQVILLKAQLNSNQRMKEDMQNSYEQMMANLKDDYNQQMEMLKQKQPPTPIIPQQMVEVSEDNIQLANEPTLDKSVESKNLEEKETQTKVVYEEKSLQTTNILTNDHCLQTDDSLDSLSQDEVIALNEKCDGLFEENQELKENLNRATSQTEVLVQRYERQEQESNNLVHILQADVKHIADERDTLKVESTSLHDCLNNLLESAKSIENMIHEKLDQMILAHTTSANLTQAGLSVLEKDSSVKLTTPKQKHDTVDQKVDDTLDNTLLSQTEGFIDDDDAGSTQNAKPQSNVHDPIQTKEVGEQLQLSVEQLLEMLDSSTTELRVNQASYEQLLQQSNAYEENIKDLTESNNQFNQSISNLEQVNSTQLEKINELLLENKYLSKELDQHKTHISESKDITDKLQNINSDFEEKIKKLSLEKEEFDKISSAQKDEIDSLKEGVSKTENDLKVTTGRCTLLEEKQKEYDKEIYDQQKILGELQSKLEDLSTERDLLLREKQEKEMKLAELKTELEQIRFDKKQDELKIPRKISKTSFENEEEIEKLQQEISSLNRIIDEMNEEKQGLRSQLLDSGYSAREDSFSIRKDMERLQSENDSYQSEIKQLKEEILTLNNALNEAIFQQTPQESQINMNVSHPVQVENVSNAQLLNMPSVLAMDVVDSSGRDIANSDRKPVEPSIATVEENNMVEAVAIPSVPTPRVPSVAANDDIDYNLFVDKLQSLLAPVSKETTDENALEDLKGITKPLKMLEKLEEEIIEKEKVFDENNKQIKTFQQEIDDRQKTIEGLEKSNNLKQDEIDTLVKDNKRIKENGETLKIQLDELDDKLSTIVAQKREIIVGLEKQISDEQAKYSNIRRQLFQTEEDCDRKVAASLNKLKEKEEEASELRIQTERLTNQIEELNQSIHETKFQDAENELEKQRDVIAKLETQLNNKQNTLKAKNRELIELKNQLAESSTRQRGDGVDIDELESELENAQATISQLEHEKKIRDDTIEKHQAKIKTLQTDNREKDAKIREANANIEKLRGESEEKDSQLEQALETSPTVEEGRKVLDELEKQLEIFKKRNDTLQKEKEKLKSENQYLMKETETLQENVIEKDRYINELTEKSVGGRDPQTTDANVSFIPQSDLVKLLLNDLQNEADEVLNLVLNYPDLHETHNTENIHELQNIWANEKEALLAVIRSLKDFIGSTTTSQLNFTIQPNEVTNETTAEATSAQAHENRENLMNLVKTIFDKEQEALLAEIESINACHAKDLPTETSSIRKHVEESKQLLADLESKDRNLLVQEISALRHTVEIVDGKIDQLNNQLSAKEKQNEKNQETILKLYEDVEEYQMKRNDLQKSLQDERAKTFELSSQLNETRATVQLLKNELATSSKEKVDSDSSSTKHQDTVMKLYAQIENEQKRFTELSDKFEAAINEKSNLVYKLSEKDLKIESLTTELETERSKAIKEHSNGSPSRDSTEDNKETMLRLYEQIEQSHAKNKELKARIENLNNEKAGLTTKLAESKSTIDLMKEQLESLHVSPTQSSGIEQAMDERYEKSQETLMKLYEIIDNEQEKNKELKKTVKSLERDNVTFAQQLREANEMIKSLQESFEREREKSKSDVGSDRESVYEEKFNDSQEKVLKLYKLVDSEQAKRKDIQKNLEKEKLESAKLRKRLSDLTDSDSERKQYNDQMSGEKERITELEKKMAVIEEQKANLENDLLREKEKLKAVYNKETKLKQKTEEVIALLEAERNKRIGLEEMLDHANSLLQKERMRVDELNQIVLKENEKLRVREQKVEELMNQLEHDTKVLEERQTSHDNIEREIYAKKNEIENIEHEMRRDKLKSDEERIKISSLLSSLDDVEHEKHKLSRALQEAKTHAKTLKHELEEKINELADIQQVKQREESAMKETIADLKEKLKNKPPGEISDDGKKLLNAGWTIAKVQRLYLKYFRAESFRKALAYQKRYLLLLLSEYQQNEESVLAFIAKLKTPGMGERKRYNTAKRRFRVAVNAVIAINRLKYLTRKYQRNLHKSSPEYLYKDKPAKNKDLPKPSLSVVTEERPVEKTRGRPTTKPNADSAHHPTNSYKRRSGSPDKRMRLNKRDSNEPLVSNHVVFSPSDGTAKAISSVPSDEKDNDHRFTKPQISHESKNQTRKDTYSPPTRLNGSSAATHVSLIVPTGNTNSNRSPRSPPRSYPRPKQLPVVPKSERSHVSSKTTTPVEPVKQDSSASLNNYISKLENLQERLKEQSKQVHKKRSPHLL